MTITFDQATTPELRTQTSADIFTRIITHGPISRVELGRATGLSAAKVTKTVTPLIRDGFVMENEHAEHSTPGRPVHPLTVVPRAMLAIGVKVNTDEVVAVSVSLGNEVLSSGRQRLTAHAPEDVIDAIVVCVRQLLDRLGDERAHVAGVGVAVSGDIDSATGTVRQSPILGWARVPLADALQGRLNLPVVIENDVHALAVAEQWFGVGVAAKSFAVVTIGAGIGCGLYINGDVVVGAHGVAGEIGHLPLAPADAVCLCGRTGCVEAVASSYAIVAAVRAAHHNEALTVEDVVTLAHDGDPIAIAAFDRAGTTIGAALAATVNLVGPEVVVVAGEGVMDYDLYERRLREEFLNHAFGAAGNCRLVVQRHTFLDWARGAAVTVFKNSLRSRAQSR